MPGVRLQVHPVKHYGIPYQGSKDKIAIDILRQLPAGARFVDLFGGGFAMSHAALLLPGKYRCVLYNEREPLLCDLIKRAIAGEFNYERFAPEFITRERFEELKEKDGYVKYIWSFSNNGEDYLFGKAIEPLKRASHEYVVFGKPAPGVPLPVRGNIRQRRLALRRWGHAQAAEMIRKNPALLQKRRKIEDKFELQQLQQLERLQQLEQLERLEQLEIVCGDYRDYEYRDGDVVYCDPPYEGTVDYGAAFDSVGFYEWAYTRPYQVWFSSYDITDKRFRRVWAKRHRGLMAGSAGAVYNWESLYTNR